MIDVLFLDPVAEKPYSLSCLGREPLGGTEATVLRVGQGLRQKGLSVAIAQSAREKRFTDHQGLRYLPYHHREPLEDARAVVLLRACKLMKSVRDHQPDAQKYLWLHCFPGARRKHLLANARRYDFSVVTVSDAHRKAVAQRCSAPARTDRLLVAYNPVVIPTFPTSPRHDPNKLVFFSSPHKGLDQVLEMFAHVRRTMPELSLYIANPGYLADAQVLDEGVIQLGALSQYEVLRHVRDALCVFYPQTRFAETFGLVFAEANAVGTPVLAHDLGSASEVLTQEQLVDCTDPKAVTSKLESWRNGVRPSLSLKPQFGLDSVIQRWVDLIHREPQPMEFEKAS